MFFVKSSCSDFVQLVHLVCNLNAENKAYVVLGKNLTVTAVVMAV